MLRDLVDSWYDVLRGRSMDYLARTLCDVLHEMRNCHRTRNYSYLMGLIEEAQMMGNRMEAGLHTKKCRIRDLEKELAALKGEKVKEDD